MRVVFSEANTVAGQPLLTVGMTGEADFVYVIRTDSKHIRFGFDHWGEGGPLSEPIPVDETSRHLVEIYLSSLHAVDGSPSSLRGYEIFLDGHSVLRGGTVPYPATADSVFVGINPLGGSTTTSNFQGEIQSSKSNR